MICKMLVQVKDYMNVPLEAQNVVRRLQFRDEEKELCKYFSYEEIIGDPEVIAPILAPYDMSVDIKGFKGNVFVGLGEKLNAAYPEDIPKPIPSNVTHVHIPNIGLLLIDEVQHLDDACTDALQRELDAGWRILAVCPPNGTRRPDYILGRTKEK